MCGGHPRYTLGTVLRFALPLLLLTGCTTEVITVDPDVDYQDEGGYVLEGEPRLEFGYYREQLYTPLDDGGECTVVPNPQGGHWTSPTIRAGGILAQVRLLCSLTTAAGEVLSETRERRRMVLSTDGSIEASNVPMFLERVDLEASVEDLYGEGATLSCVLEDDEERMAALEVDCVLQPGTG